MIKALFYLFFFSLALLSCNNSRNKENSIVSYMLDSTNIFKNIQNIQISGEIDEGQINFKYYSISKEDFLIALKRNEDNIRFFNRSSRQNEWLNAKYSLRKDSILEIGDYEFVDSKVEDKRYFLENKINNYFIIKTTQFEDAETIFLNSETGKQEFCFLGISSYTDAKNSLMFYSSPMRSVIDDPALICIFKIETNKIDTLLYQKTEWYPKYAFFDKDSSWIFYIHSFYDSASYKLKSTFAKIELEMK